MMIANGKTAQSEYCGITNFPAETVKASIFGPPQSQAPVSVGKDRMNSKTKNMAAAALPVAAESIGAEGVVDRLRGGGVMAPSTGM
jgi:hypothetical protein